MQRLTSEQEVMLTAIEMLTNEQRKELREKLKHLSIIEKINSLYFNYETQEWIDEVTPQKRIVCSNTLQA